MAVYRSGYQCVIWLVLAFGSSDLAAGMSAAACFVAMNDRVVEFLTCRVQYKISWLVMILQSPCVEDLQVIGNRWR
jgi:hypothetical protein